MSTLQSSFSHGRIMADCVALKVEFGSSAWEGVHVHVNLIAAKTHSRTQLQRETNAIVYAGTYFTFEKDSTCDISRTSNNINILFIA
jgi:hypothetical protein